MQHRYQLHRLTTSNGIRLVVNPDPAIPAVAVNLWYGVGSADERPGRTGFAHLFEHLMFSGSAQVASGEHLAAIQAVGGSANATTSFDRTNYFEMVPTGALEFALWLEAERLSSLLEAVTERNLDTQRDVVTEEKRQRYDNVPYGDAFASLLELGFGQAGSPDSPHPYAHMPIGSLDDLAAASLADVHAFFRRHYRPANLVLSLAGEITADDALDLVERHFSDLPAGEPAIPPQGPVLDPLTDLPRLTLTADVPQDAVYCCWRAPAATDPASDTISLGLRVLADGLSARLHQDLVRTDLADSAETFDLGLARGTSLVVASATCVDGVEPERLEAALMETWERFRTEGPSEAEHRRALAQATRDHWSALAALDDRVDALSEATGLLDDPDRIMTQIDRLRATTPEEVAGLFADRLSPDHRATLTYRRLP
ncbi:MAG: insulinase family protein [Propionibacteriaceae bacterium]|jgi:predicted Zn-dependent peptidase|nr:insulinase family protein [Propionibacteriaceae bacterium]